MKYKVYAKFGGGGGGGGKWGALWEMWKWRMAVFDVHFWGRFLKNCAREKVKKILCHHHVISIVY